MSDRDVVRVQRLASYAVIVDPPDRTADGAGRILLVRLTARTARPGWWTLPGGGVEHGEHPRDAVIREVLEETGLTATLLRLLDIDSHHVVRHLGGQLDAAVTEDFHAVRILWEATAPGDEPVAVEVDGSSDLARWVPLTEVDAMDLVDVARLGVQHARAGLATSSPLH